MIGGLVAVFVLGCAAVGLSLAVFLKYKIKRPEILVFDTRDTVIVACAVVGVPFVYGHLPDWAVVTVLFVVFLSALHLLAESFLPGARGATPLALALCTGDAVLGLTVGTGSTGYLVLNDALVLLAVVGVVNLWAQSGMKVRHLAVWTAVLAVYDLLATWVFTAMNETVLRLEQLPFSPVLAWHFSAGATISLGMGDVLVISLAPILFLKAFGRTPAIVVAAIGLATQLGVLVGVYLAGSWISVPVMTFYGPLLLGVFAVCRRRTSERTTAEFLAAVRQRLPA